MSNFMIRFYRYEILLKVAFLVKNFPIKVTSIKKSFGKMFITVQNFRIRHPMTTDRNDDNNYAACFSDTFLITIFFK